MSRTITPEVLKQKIKEEVSKRSRVAVSSEAEYLAYQEYVSQYGPINEVLEGDISFRQFLHNKVSHFLRENSDGFNE